MAKANERKCPYCDKNLDIKIEEYVHRKNRYWHKKCYDEKFPNGEPDTNTISAQNRRKCYYCGQYLDITKDYRMANTTRYAHVECFNKNHTPDDDYIDKIYSFLKKDMHINYDYVQCEKQREKFIKMGYTNKGILYALKYFYLVKKQSTEKSGNRIGIVPYVYDEARAYYIEKEKEKKTIVKAANKEQKQKPKTIIIKEQEQKIERNFINLDFIEE